MSTIPGIRHCSGETCPDGGWFEFDGYLDGSSELLPQLDELRIAMGSGQRFPRVTERHRQCFWRLAEGSVWTERAVTGVDWTDAFIAGCERSSHSRLRERVLT